ncbi:hypothetical protein BC936DRAFT_138679, partial [Jimgerdemannia flammicorona]
KTIKFQPVLETIQEHLDIHESPTVAVGILESPLSTAIIRPTDTHEFPSCTATPPAGTHEFPSCTATLPVSTHELPSCTATLPADAHESPKSTATYNATGILELCPTSAAIDHPTNTLESSASTTTNIVHSASIYEPRASSTIFKLPTSSTPPRPSAPAEPPASSIIDPDDLHGEPRGLRRRAPTNYALPSLHRKLRQGDPYTFILAKRKVCEAESGGDGREGGEEGEEGWEG